MTDIKVVAIQSYLESAKQQDFAAMAAHFSTDLVYTVPGRGPLSGRTTGASAALDYFGALMGLTGGTYAIVEIVDWLVSDNRVALIASETATRNGRRLDWTRLVVFTFRDGLIAEVVLYDDKLQELDEFLGD